MRTDIKEEKTEKTIAVLADELKVLLGQIEATLYVDMPKVDNTEDPMTTVDRIYVSLGDCKDLAERIFAQTTRIS